MKRIRWSAAAALAVIIYVTIGSRVVQTRKAPQSSVGPSIAAQPLPPAAADQLVGNSTCQTCHKSETTEFGKTAHAHLDMTNKPGLTCEGCHGAGKPHVDSEQAAHGDDEKTAAADKLIFTFHGSAKENSDRCLTCHITSSLQDSFAHSEHVIHNVGCNECHSTHLVNAIKDQSKPGLMTAQAAFFATPKLTDETRWLHDSLLKASQPQLCYTCHATVQTQFAQPVHHRVPEGSMKCTDCHNAHGSSNQANLIKTQTETCLSCHVEKHGPFVYEHPASKVSGCIVCHNPHGSTNRQLLVRREGRQLCLQCHTSFHSQAQVPHSRLGFQTSGECTRCHVSIHGSNFDPNFLR